MTIYYVFLASLVQAATEFLPISSSGHLFFIGELFQEGVDNLFFDVSLHLGTVLAVICYFYKDVLLLIKGGFNLIGFKKTEESKFALNVIISSVPIAIVGFILVKTGIIYAIRSNGFVLFNLAFFAILLFIGDRYGGKNKENNLKVEDLTKKQALFTGLAQTIALCPGVSRSGITMTALRFMKFDRASSARYGMLISIPGVLGATLLLALDIKETSHLFDFTNFALGIFLSFIFGLVVISFLMNYVRNNSFTIFVVYRLALFALLLLFI